MRKDNPGKFQAKDFEWAFPTTDKTEFKAKAWTEIKSFILKLYF